MPTIVFLSIKSRNKISEIIIIFLLFLFALILGRQLYENAYDRLLKYDGIQNETEITVVGMVKNVWDNGHGKAVEVLGIEDDCKVICYFEEFEYEIGRRILVSGKKKQFNTATNQGQFDVKKYYNSKEIFLVLSDCSVLRVAKQYSEISHGFFLIRQSLKEAIADMCNKEEAGVLCAMLFGDKEHLESEIKDIYTSSGIGHILAISGLHISLAGGMIYRLVRKFTRQPVAFMVSSGFMICFCAMSGASVSTIRAIIMFMINIFAKVIGRKYDIKNSMAISMIWILWDNPLYINNGGFILSYLSIGGIAFVVPLVKEIFGKYINTKSFFGRLVNSLITSLSLHFVTLMAVASMYYEVPLYSPFLNVLLIPLMGVLVISGFIGGVLYYVFIPLGKIVITLCVFILKIYKWCCEISMLLPFSTCVTGGKNIVVILVYYGILIALVLLCKFLKRRGVGVLKIVVTIALGTVVMLEIVINRPNYEFKIVALDVGQGDCIYVESPEGLNYLIDGGSADKSRIGEYIIEPYLLSEGRNTLTAVVVTHPDMDHVSGIIEMLQRGKISVENLIFGNMVDVMDENYVELVEITKQKNINVVKIGEGECFGTELQFLCLSPSINNVYEDANSASVVLLGEYDDFKFILTGDIGAKEEKTILQGKYRNKIRNLDLLKVAHHGSKGSNSEEFVAWVNPEISLISCGINNMYGHPHEIVVERLLAIESEVWITKYDGAASVGLN